MHKQNSIAGELANDGFRLTPQRVLILEALDMAEGHMSAEDIYAEVGQEYPNINIFHCLPYPGAFKGARPGAGNRHG
jgi:Fe2+/Zn2+ uptake regulation proteins